MATFTEWSHAVEVVVAILKRRFPNLTVEESMKIAHEIVEALLGS